MAESKPPPLLTGMGIFERAGCNLVEQAEECQGAHEIKENLWQAKKPLISSQSFVSCPAHGVPLDLVVDDKNSTIHLNNSFAVLQDPVVPDEFENPALEWKASKRVGDDVELKDPYSVQRSKLPVRPEEENCVLPIDRSFSRFVKGSQPPPSDDVILDDDPISSGAKGEDLDLIVPPFDEVESKVAKIEARIAAREALPNSASRIASDVEHLWRKLVELKGMEETHLSFVGDLRPGQGSLHLAPSKREAKREQGDEEEAPEEHPGGRPLPALAETHADLTPSDKRC
ncbi:hypothetical protein Nepgr_012467 [Nepenthes gracilis]|uniref:Uncharacterized protein n=1 Tax=Nepenthes gracilis TaxID=150966 RepID=A0AAD3SH11_NEPGR|nr:hypothetical protein Nepgr_012467 [Nepenthes gracilis]